MKTYIATLVSVCANLFQVTAQSTSPAANPSLVTVYCEEGLRLYVFVDNQLQNQEAHASVDLSLRPGMHYIRAQSEDGKLATAQSIVYLQPKEQRVFQFEMPYPRLAEKEFAPHTAIQSSPKLAAVAGCSQTMSAATHNRVLTSIGNQPSDPARLIVAKQAAKYNCLTADQIVAIMRKFYADDTRIEFAAFAQSYCTDLQHFYQVNDAFSATNSAIKLQEALDNSKFRSEQTPTYKPEACVYTLTRADFERLSSSLDQQTQDDARTIVAKQATQNACLTADQIKTILMKFSQEATRIQFASYAYTRCSDVYNYFLINDAFDAASSVIELESVLRLVE